MAAFPGAAGRGRRRHRRVVVLRPAGAGRLDGRPDSAGLPVAHAAGPGAGRSSWCRARSGIALMSFTETIAAGRAFARPDDPPINANRELVATGAANLGGALLGAMPAGGGTSQTAVVRAAGGRSQKASLVTAGAAAGDHAAARAAAGPAAERHAGGGRHRLLGRADPAGGVPRHPQGAHDGVSLGADRLRSACWCSAR